MSLQTALKHHQAGHLAQAEAIYHELLQRPQHRADAWHLLGDIAVQRQQYPQAVELIHKAIANAGRIATYHITLGRAYRGLGELDQAIACYQRALELQLGNAVALNSLGNAYHAQGNLESATASYQKAVLAQPLLVEAQVNLGNVLLQQSRAQEALMHYLYALQHRPRHVDLHNKVGNCLLAMGQLDEALECFATALQLDPQMPELHCNKGNALQQQGQLEQAVACYQESIRLDPQQAQAYNNLGNALVAQGQIDAGIQAFEQAIANQKDFGDAYGNLGLVLKAQGQWGQALNHLRHAANLLPHSPQAHYNLGLALTEAAQWHGAVKSYQMAIALRPDYVPALCNLGVAQFKLKDYDGARASFAAVLERVPQHADAHYNLGALYGELGYWELAEQSYRAALQAEPDRVSAHVNLAAILTRQGDVAQAKQHLDAAYQQQCVFYTRAPRARRSVLLLLDAGQGNVPFQYLLPPEKNTLVEWMIEYAQPGQYPSLPHYDLVFNAVGDPDVTGPLAQPMAEFLHQCQRPVLNDPKAVARTARHLLPELCRGISGLVVPPVWRFEAGVAWPGFPEGVFPVLLRPLGSHGGHGLVRVDSPQALVALRQQTTDASYLSHFVDYRSDDGHYRKYRMIFVDRQPYAYHLAIGSDWMVHYGKADMEAHAWKLEEEQRFLADPATVLGAKAMQALQTLAQRLDLDYAGVDFGLLPDGRLLVFEANATMLTHPEQDKPELQFKNAYVQKIFDAFEALVQRAANCRA